VLDCEAQFGGEYTHGRFVIHPGVICVDRNVIIDKGNRKELQISARGIA